MYKCYVCQNVDTTARLQIYFFDKEYLVQLLPDKITEDCNLLMSCVSGSVLYALDIPTDNAEYRLCETHEEKMAILFRQCDIRRSRLPQR